MKFVLLVEGQTERDSAANFLKRWLDPRLRQPVGMQTVPFRGFAHFERDFANRAHAYLNGRKHDEIIAVIGMLDLYGPTFYPRDKHSVAERFTWAKDFLERQVGHEKFRMFFAVHEFEAWLLSDPAVFPREVTRALPKGIDRPEQVNFNEPPAKLLDRVYQRATNRNYKKTTQGGQLFRQLNPEIVVGKCPYLKMMLDEMLRLATAAGLG